VFKKIAPLSFENHKSKKVKSIDSFDFIAKTHMATVMVHEFPKVAPTYPIVFLQDPKNDSFRPVALLGLEEGENLFIQDGKWMASYIPAIIRRYPFVLAKGQEEGRFTICIDEECEFVNDQEGQDLFTEEGKPSEALERVKKYLQELQQMELFTEAFVAYLSEKNLFTPLNMNLKVGAGVKNVTGAYMINEERLNSLSGETFEEMRKKNYLAVIYAHLTSLGQMERLVSFKNNTVASIQSLADASEND
jgi:hypothetical protein